MEGEFFKYIPVCIICITILIVISIYLLRKKTKKCAWQENIKLSDMDVERTLDLGQSPVTNSNGAPNLSEGIFEIQYDVTFIHTDEIID